MDNIAMREAKENPDWIIIGLRYFNVYGPREAHKGVPASNDLSSRAADEGGAATAHFQTGRSKARFRLREGRGGRKHSRARSEESGIYNLGSGQARSFNELVDVLNKCLGTKFQPDYIENPHAHYQISPKRTWTRCAARSVISHNSHSSAAWPITSSGCIRRLNPERDETRSPFQKNFVGRLISGGETLVHRAVERCLLQNFTVRRSWREWNMNF